MPRIYASESIYDSDSRRKFEDIIGLRDPDVCWDWPMSKAYNGAGIFCPIGAKPMLAARYSASIYHRPPNDGEIVMSECGNTSCVNPHHLYWGSREQRIKEAYHCGHVIPPGLKGEQMPTALLDDEKVEFIRTSERSGVFLATYFGVSPTTISQCQLGKTWAHLPRVRETRRTGSGSPDGGYVEIAGIRGDKKWRR